MGFHIFSLAPNIFRKNELSSWKLEKLNQSHQIRLILFEKFTITQNILQKYKLFL